MKISREFNQRIKESTIEELNRLAFHLDTDLNGAILATENDLEYEYTNEQIKCLKNVYKWNLEDILGFVPLPNILN